MNSKKSSPQILSIKWGRMDVETLGIGKDYKLWPGGGRAWDWQETGTQHSPGIQVTDVEELVEHGSRIIILSRGRYRRLKTQKETLAFLQKKGVEVIVKETKKGVKI